MTQHCRWCEKTFEAVKRGNQEKRFCGNYCRLRWNSAARKLGAELERKGILKLREWVNGNDVGLD